MYFSQLALFAAATFTATSRTITAAHSIDTSLATRTTLLAKRNLCNRDIKCILNNEVMEGPFYVAEPLVRSDIRETREGARLSLTIQVLDVRTCEPASDVWVDIWHADGRGEYSGWASEDNLLSLSFFPSPPSSSSSSLSSSSSPADAAADFDSAKDWNLNVNDNDDDAHVSPYQYKKRGIPIEASRFLRGVQRADESGKVVFETIVPGWYEGRCDHIHVRIHSTNATVQDGHLMGGTVSHTGQLFFDDALVESLRDPESGMAPYNLRTDTPRKNMEDGLYRDEDGVQQVVNVQQRTASVKDGFTGEIIIGVDPSIVQPPSKGPGGPPGGHWPGHGGGPPPPSPPSPPSGGNGRGHGTLVAFIVIVALVGASAGGYYIYREKYAPRRIQLE